MLFGDKKHSGAAQHPERDGLSESGRPSGHHVGKRGLSCHEERHILSSGRKDAPVRASVYMDPEYTPEKFILYRSAYEKECGEKSL